ncbi:hypothetical protein Tco_0758915 [Tanacetum coccineum]
MANVPRLQELAAAGNSNNLADVNEIKMLTSELNLFGGPVAVQCAEYLKQLSKSEVLMLELRKTIAEVHIQVHKKIDFLTDLMFC